MKTNLASYILANIAKDNGFNEPCSAKINHKEEVTLCELGQTITNQFLLQSKAAPTLEELAQWFLAKYNMTVLPKENELINAFDKLGELRKYSF
jgi:hypothetical protein